MSNQNLNQQIENNYETNKSSSQIKFNTKDESNVNIIYDKKINEKKINLPLTSQTHYATNHNIEGFNNNNILFNDNDELIYDLNFGFEDNKKKNEKNKRKYHRKRNHNDLHLDNIRSNIKNKFFNFIIEFFNGLIISLIGQDTITFKKINYKDKNRITKIELYHQFNMTMKEILELDIQSNYTNFPKDHNKNLICKLLNIINENYSYYISIFNMKLYDFYEKIFVNGNRLELEKEFNLSKNAFLLNETILNLRKNDKYKGLFKKTALNLLEFSQIKNVKENNNIENDLSKIKGEKDIFETESLDDNNSNSSKNFLNFDESFFRKRNRDEI